MRDKDKALEGMEQLASEIGRSRLQTPLDTVLNSYQAAMDGLSKTEPVSILPDRTVSLIDTSIVMAHNAYNSLSESAMWPNQQLSLTELLDIGVRGLELDVYWDNGVVRLCHNICTPPYADILLGSNRPLAEALSEIQTWLDRHPTEQIILKFEDYLDPAKTGAPVKELARILQDNLNTTSIFTPTDLTQTFNGLWPSINQMNAIGKQLVLMPQNSGEDKQLYFNGGWGRGYKNTFNTGTIAKVRPNNLTIPRGSDATLIEVGEDRTFIGSFVDSARKIPFLGRLIPHDVIAGQMTKEEIQQLRTNGVNLISLDNIESNDSRLTTSVTLSDLRDNAYLFIPLAVAAAALTPRDQGEKLFSTTAQRVVVQLLVATTFPDEGRVLYHTVDAGISAYNSTKEEAARANQVMTTFDKVKAVGYSLIPAVGKAVETIAKIGLSNITGQSISSSTATPSTIVGTVGKTAVNVVAAKVIIDPLIGAATGAFKGHGIVEGFLQGVDSSMFGMTSFASKKDPSTTQQSVPLAPNASASVERDNQAGRHRPITGSMHSSSSHTKTEIRRRQTSNQTKGQQKQQQ